MRIESRRMESRIPILMYHGISALQKAGEHPYYETFTTPAVFNRQMAFLKDNDYDVIGLKDLIGGSSNPGKPSDKKVVITFDDGLLDFYTTGFSILKRYAYSATVFLPTGLMGKEMAGQTVMSWQNARKLADEGVEFGSHSVSHPKLVELEPKELEKEIRLSKEKIEIELEKEIKFFSYPYAFPENKRDFVDHLEKLLIRSGYRAGVTTIIGRSSDNDRKLFLKRLPINDYDDIPLFKAKLEGSYDWLHAVQKMLKKAKSFAQAG